jgi:hypothetical protein
MDAPVAHLAPWRLWLAGPRRRILRTRFCGLPKSSMFGEMPRDIRYLVQSQPLLPSPAFSGCLKRRAGRNDLKFRCGAKFCNIEPQICQYG